MNGLKFISAEEIMDLHDKILTVTLACKVYLIREG